MPADVSVRDLTKRYGDLVALRGVSFDVAAGEIFGLLGPNGAGKTTAIECILGLRRPDGGSITIAGIDALAHPEQVKSTLGAALQGTALQDKITPREALTLFASFYRDSIKPDDLIERFALAEKADAAFDTLSGGQKQRLALALAFVNDPKLVFLDEPTAGLDPQSRHELHGVIAQMRRDGHTVVLCTHYLEEAQRLCDHIAIIDHGRLIAVGTPDELIAAAKTPSRVRVKTAQPIEPGKLKLLPAVVSAEQQDGQWQLGTTNAGQTAIGLLKMLESESNELLDLQIRRPTLEDVFLELTGTSLREGLEFLTK
jgi:ABC-2 type transport system ATP-binding protein